LSDISPSFTYDCTPETMVRRATIAAGVVGGAAGALPVPFIDVAAVTPIQASMIIGISRAYGLPDCERDATVPVALLVSAGTMRLGRTAAKKTTDIIVAKITKDLARKFVPVVGSLVGATVSTTFAVTTTKALGEAWSKVCEYASRNELKELDRFLESDEGRFIVKFLTALGMSAMLKTISPQAPRKLGSTSSRSGLKEFSEAQNANRSELEKVNKSDKGARVAKLLDRGLDTVSKGAVVGEFLRKILNGEGSSG